MGLTLMSFPRFQALHIKFRTSLNVKRGAEPTTEQLAWDVGVVSRYVSRATCLTQALAGQVLLERYGYPALVHVGVTKEEGKGTFQAHRGPRAMARWLSANQRSHTCHSRRWVMGCALMESQVSERGSSKALALRGIASNTKSTKHNCL